MSQAQSLPARPNLQHLKKQAKQRLAVLRATRRDAKLADAQLAVARQYGFGSWRVLHRQVTTAPLIMATAAGDLAAVQALLGEGLSIEARDQFGNTPLGWVRGKQMLPILRLLLQRGADPNAPAYNGHSTVGLYAYECEPQAVKLLLEHGADPNKARESSGETPLHLAMVKDRPGRLECVRLLLAAGADPNRRAKVGPKADREDAQHVHGETPLHIAAITGDPPLIELLLENGADPTIRDADGKTPAQIAEERGHTELAKVLRLGHAPKTKERSDEKVTRFLEAAVSFHTGEQAVKLKEAEAMRGEHPEIAKASLLTACAVGDFRAAAAILKNDPAQAARPAGPKQWLPLLYLCFSRYLKFRKQREGDFVRVAKLLLDHGADPNSLFVHEGFNETALYGAAGIANRPKLTRLLLEAGADPNDKETDRAGAESLYHSAEHADNACLKLLLRAKPRPEGVSYCLLRKLDFENIRGARLMLDHGADPNKFHALSHAIKRGRGVKVIELLITRGADVNAPDKEGLTPLRRAMRLGRKDVVKVLLKHGARDDANHREQFLATCAAGNARAARKLLAEEPELVNRLSATELRILPDAAAGGRLPAVRLMLDLGFSINAKGDWGGSAVQQAAWKGHVEVVKLLIRRGADLMQKHEFGGDTLGAAIHGASHAGHKNGPQVAATVATAMKGADLMPYVRFAENEGNLRVVAALRKVAPRQGGAR